MRGARDEQAHSVSSASSGSGLTRSVLVRASRPAYQPLFAQTPLPPSRARRRSLVVAAVVLALVAGGWWVADYLGDRPARRALQRAEVAYSSMLAAFGEADDLPELQLAGEQAADHAEALAAIAAELGELEPDAVPLVTAQQRLAAVAATLAGLTERRLAIWGATERGLDQARSELLAVSRRLDESVTDPAKTIEHLRGVVGASATGLVSRVARRLVDGLAQATTTAQVRRIALDARDDAAVVAAAQTGLSGASAGSVEAVGAVLEELGRLRSLDRDHLGRWSRLRRDLVRALAGTTMLDGRPAVDQLDQLVGDGRAAMASWRAALARAKRRQAEARAAITAYSSSMGTQLSAYEASWAAFDQGLTRLAAGERGLDPASTVSAAASTHATILGGVRAVTAPAALQEAHRSLQRVLGQSARLLARAQPFVTHCSSSCSGGYAWIGAAADRIRAHYAEAELAWREDLDAASQRVSGRSLPRKPRV